MSHEPAKVKTKRQVEEIWLTDRRLRNLARQKLLALIARDYKQARRIEEECKKLRQEMLDNYEIIL